MLLEADGRLQAEGTVLMEQNIRSDGMTGCLNHTHTLDTDLP